MPGIVAGPAIGYTGLASARASRIRKRFSTVKRIILVLVLAALNAPLYLWLCRKLFGSAGELRRAIASWFGPYYEDLEDRARQRIELTGVLKLVFLVLFAMALIWIELEQLLRLGL